MTFTDVLNEHVISSRTTREGAQEYWYPSSLGGCERKAVLRHAGVVGNPIDIRGLRKMWMGEQLHGKFQEVLENTPGVQLIGHELRVRDDEFHVSGKIDSLLQTDQGLEVWEYKSIASGSFRYADLPKPEHVLQLAVYLTFPASRPLGRFDIDSDGNQLYELMPVPDRGVIIYWSKDDGLIEEHRITATPELRSNVKETLRRLEAHYQAYLKDNLLPPVLPMQQVLREDGTPFFYVKTGEPKMVHDWHCVSKNGTNPCEYFMNACKEVDWDEVVRERDLRAEGTLPEGGRDPGATVQGGGPARSEGSA